MNIKFKASHKLTATATIINDNNAIFTDECTASPTNTAHIIQADNLKELWSKIYTTTLEVTKQTHFKPILALVHNNKCIIHNFATRTKVEVETVAKEESVNTNDAPEM